MPLGKFANAACLCGDQIVVTSGISDLMLNMGMRSVPIGDRHCYSFNYLCNQWKQLPDVPIGKLHPTLVTINSRFIFQIGGFDDFDFDIYRLDMKNPQSAWKTLSLDLTVPIIDDSIYLQTRSAIEKREKFKSTRSERFERESEDDSDVR